MAKLGPSMMMGNAAKAGMGLAGMPGMQRQPMMPPQQNPVMDTGGSPNMIQELMAKMQGNNDVGGGMRQFASPQYRSMNRGPLY